MKKRETKIYSEDSSQYGRAKKLCPNKVIRCSQSDKNIKQKSRHQYVDMRLKTQTFKQNCYSASRNNDKCAIINRSLF